MRFNIAASSGDLLESAIRRDAGVKDFGTTPDGHVGILGWIDALLATVPWCVLFIKDYFGLGRF
jgi:phosphatidate cytidylyltransferase